MINNQSKTQIDIGNEQDPLRSSTITIEANQEAISIMLEIKFDGTSYKNVLSKEELLTMDYFKHFKDCRTIEVK